MKHYSLHSNFDSSQSQDKYQEDDDEDNVPINPSKHKPHIKLKNKLE